LLASVTVRGEASRKTGKELNREILKASLKIKFAQSSSSFSSSSSDFSGHSEDEDDDENEADLESGPFSDRL
jgi:hypothetical protein